MTWINRVFRGNATDPADALYAGQIIEQGQFTNKNKDSWDYQNFNTKKITPDFLKSFDFFRWNFFGFNK
jgi:hypothetical protein